MQNPNAPEPDQVFRVAPEVQALTTPMLMLIGDQDFDSFEQFVEQAPWLAGLVFMVTALVFVVPLLAIVLLVASGVAYAGLVFVLLRLVPGAA